LKPPDADKTSDARWTALFDRIALFLTLAAFLLREWLTSAIAGPGLNLFIHLLFWISLTLWFAGRATAGGAAWRFTGFEFAFLAFSGFALVSVLQARYKLTALDHALTWLSLALFFVLCVHVIGKQTLLLVLSASLFTLSLYALIQYFLLFPMLQPTAQATGSIELARRIRTNEVFASFAGPNQLAAFLALLLPLLAGSMIDTREFRLRGAALAAGLFALALTGSLGGWVALGCGAVTMAALAVTRARGRTLAVGIGAGALALAVGLLLASPLLSAVARKSHSMHVRAVYWRATGKMIASAPMAGVGLDNWQEHYFHAKSEIQQEAKKTHNDYLQILAETGILGFLAFSAIVVLGLRKALVRESTPDADPDPPSPWLVAGVIATLILLGCIQAGDIVSTGLSIVLGAVWFGFWMLLRRLGSTSTFTWTRMGAAAGFVAFLVHMVVDFLVYDFGLAAAFVAMLALLAMLRGRSVEVRLPRPVCAAATAILMALSLPLLTFITPRALAADGEIEEARLALDDLESGRSPNPTKLISDALRVAESAQAHNPFNPEAYQLFSRAKFHEWDLLQKAGARDTKTLETAEGTVIQALENAIALRPLSSPIHYEKSQAHRIFRRYYLKTGKASELARAKAAEHLRLAVDHQRRAYELYPTFCRNAYLLARLLEISRDPEAPRYYREALRLGDLAGLELENLDRLKLDPLARARALRGTGKPLEAHDVLEGHLRNAIKGLPSAEARLRLERFVKMSDDEMDEGMAPVIKDVVDAIMRDLK
jgi:O-antigen ligase